MDRVRAATDPTPEALLARWQAHRRPGDLAALFDATAPELFRLALHLCPDAATAEDALQQTYLAVLLRASSWDGTRPALPWLTGILRNEVLMARRSGARRPDPGRLAAPDVPDDPAFEAADAEERERLRHAIQDLPEPYREAALLRWRYGLEPSAIADVKGVPPGTVRSWLHRALERLRSAMGAGLPALAIGLRPARGLEGVRAELLRRAAAEAAKGGTIAAAAAGTLLGGFVMANKAVVAGAILLVLALGGWFAVETATSKAPDAGTIPAPAQEETKPVARPIAPRRAAPSEPIASEQAAAGGAQKPAKAKAVASRVNGRIVDESGRPRAGAKVAIQVSDLPNLGATVTTGADGVFGLSLDLPVIGPWRTLPAGRTMSAVLTTSAPAAVTSTRTVDLAENGDLALGDVVVGPGGTITGRVVDPSGVPIADAWVGLENLKLAATPESERRLLGRNALTSGIPTTTAPAGAFRLEGVPPGPTRLWAGKEGLRARLSDVVEVRSGAEAANVELRLEPEQREDRVAGRVVRADGSEVGSVSFFMNASDGGRRFVGHGLMSGPGATFNIPVEWPASFHLLAEDPYRKTGAAFAGPLRPGDRDVVIRFPEPTPVALHVTSRDGQDVTRWVAHLSHGTIRFGLSFRGVDGGEHPGGTAEFFAPGFPFKVEIRADGYFETKVGPFDPAAGLPKTIEAVLDPVAAVRGRVTADGRLVRDARVLVQRVADADEKIVHDDLPARLYPDPESETRTGDDGRFVLKVNDRASYVIRVEADGYAPGEFGPTAIDPKTGLDGVEVRLSRGGTIEGGVLVAPGRSPEGIVVVANRGDCRPRSVRVGADGRYRFERLIPGPWIVKDHPYEVPGEAFGRGGTSYGPGTNEFRWTCTVQEGQTVTCDVDLTGASAVTLHGRATIGSPSDPRGWTAALVPDSDHGGAAVAGPVTLGADGVFDLAAPDPGKVRVMLVSPDGGLQVLQSVALSAGRTSWSIDLTLGRVEGTIERNGTATCVWQGEGGRWAVASAKAGDDGRFVLPRVPAGGVKLVQQDAATRSEADPRRWTVRAECVVPAGGTARVE